MPGTVITFSETKRTRESFKVGDVKQTKQLEYKDDQKSSTKTANFGKGIESSFNRHTLFQYTGGPWNGNELSKDSYKLENWSSVSSAFSKNPTALKIITGLEGFIAAQYTSGDFALARYYGKIPNNQMITLRRFPMPIHDNLFESSAQDSEGVWHDVTTPDMARAVTWMSEATENKLTDILNFGVGFNWKEIESSSQTMDPIEGGMPGMGDPQDGGFFQSLLMAGQGINPAQAQMTEAWQGTDPLADTYPNYVHGPLNVIHKTLMQDRGLKFDQDFTLNFHYDLRAIGDKNPKLNFLDLFSNLLVLTYNTAPFWGGETRMKPNFRVGKPLGNYDHLIEGDYKAFKESAFKDMGKMVDRLTADENGEQPEGWLSWFSKAGNAIGKITSNMLGSFFLKHIAGKQNPQIVQALLSGDPIGQWHLTIGNPLNPVAMIGNLVLEDAKFEFEGPLGFDDFPSKLKMTVTLKPGRARDKSEIESMFNVGRGRLYYMPDVAREGSPSVDYLTAGYEGNKTSAYGVDPGKAGLESGTFDWPSERAKTLQTNMFGGVNDYMKNDRLENIVFNSVNN